MGPSKVESMRTNERTNVLKTVGTGNEFIWVLAANTTNCVIFLYFEEGRYVFLDSFVHVLFALYTDAIKIITMYTHYTNTFN